MTDYTDLWRDLNSVARLYGYCTDDQNAQKVARVCTEAAAAIEALQAENERLRKAAERALQEAVADDMDEWFADLRAALTGSPR